VSVQPIDRAQLLALLDRAQTATEITLALLEPRKARLLRHCAVARRFNRQLVHDVIGPAAGIASDQKSFDQVTELPCIGPDPGRPDWYRVAAEDRTELEQSWFGAAAEAEGFGESAYRDLNRRLADWFAGLGHEGELEALFHRLVADLDLARKAVREAYEYAERRFDLARCESLLAVLDERAPFLDPELASFRTDARGLLRARSAVADDYYATARYLNREHLITALERLLADPARFVMNLYGAGGSGKTMFLRWLSARYCLQRQIPVARVDFDFLDESETGLEPRFFFGKLAERLNPQLRAQPFGELIDTVREMRTAALSQRASGVRRSSRNARAEEQEVTTRFASALEQNCRGPVILVFDTLEDAALKHGVDLPTIVQAIVGVRNDMEKLAAKAGRQAPHLVLILAGRYTLEQQYPALHKACRAVMIPCETTPFDADESRRYLLENRAVPESEALVAAVQRARGSPFKLMLYADVLLTSPSISAADINRFGRVDLLYLIERVLKRIPDYPLRWVLRYGVIARRLTRRFLEEVLGPHLARAMRGNRRYDDPAIDDVKDAGWPSLWYGQDRASRQGPVDYDALWRRLREYASASSWISSADDAPDALFIQPVVTHPMRRVLRRQRVFLLVQRTAVRVLAARLAKGRDSVITSEVVAESLKALTYHEFQLDPARGAGTWRKRLRDYRVDPVALRALASVVLSEDLRESEADREEGVTEPKLVSPEVEARAEFALVEAESMAAAEAAGEEQQRLEGEARWHLGRFDALQAGLTTRVVPLIAEATMRWKLAGDVPSREHAIEQLCEAKQGHLSSEQREQLLVALETAFADTDPARAMSYARALAQLARDRGDAAAYYKAVHSLLGYHERANAYATALAECRAAQAALRKGRWHGRRESNRLLRERQALLEADNGMVARGLAYCRRVSWPKRAGAARDHENAAQSLLLASFLFIADDDPLEALKVARLVARSLEVGPRRKMSAAALQRRHRLRIECLIAEGEALRRLMEFGPALEVLQAAQVSAAETGEVEAEMQVRLTKARVYLYYVRDLRQAAEHLDGDEEAFAEASPTLRLQHSLLRAALYDRRGDGSAVAKQLAIASELAFGFSKAQRLLALSLSALSLEHVVDRVQYLERLRDALKSFDSPAVRVARLRALRYCEPVAAVPSPLRKELLALVRLSPSGGRGRSRTAPADRLRLRLMRNELVRVLGDHQASANSLRGLRREIAKYRRPFRDREIAASCDRLGIAPDEVLPTGWLKEFERTFKGQHTLCGVTLLGEARREFRNGSAARSFRLATRSRQLLEDPQTVRTVHHAWVLDLLATLARENPHQGNAAELTATAARAAADVGARQSGTGLDPLADARRDAWRAQLGGVETVGVRLDSSREATLISYVPGVPSPVQTQRLVTGVLADTLTQLSQGPIGGSASLPLIEHLAGSWSDFGLLVGRTLLPQTLRAAVSSRLGVDDPSFGIGIILECERSAFHAVPWELAALDDANPRPIVYEPHIRQVWRAGVGTLMSDRVTWLQHALGAFLGERLVIDEVVGPVTERALCRAQERLGLPADGRLTSATRLALREALRDRRPRGERPSVLLVSAHEAEQMISQRGFRARGIDLAAIYRRHGFDVAAVAEPNPAALRKALAEHRFDVLHLAVPVAEARSGNELYLLFGSASGETRGPTAFSSKLLASLLPRAPVKGADKPLPFVVLDVPAPPSFFEAVRQLVLRNVFASHLFLLGRLPAVLATGLGDPGLQLTLSECLIEGLAAGMSPGELAQRMRNSYGGSWTQESPQATTSALIATAGIALFARDPDLAPADLANQMAA
jgi:peptidoglycan hydrolase-like protein with peptidoglycan-binding domain